MSYLSLCLSAHNVFPSNISISHMQKHKKTSIDYFKCVQHTGQRPETHHTPHMQKHIRSGLLYNKIKHIVNGMCWNFNMDAKLDILSKLLGKYSDSCASYSVLYNDSWNLVVPQNLGENVAGSFQNGRIEFKYYSPYLNVDVQCTQFVVGGSADTSTT